jgi:hypothetical protein
MASVQDEEGIGATKGFTPFVETHSADPALFAVLDSLYLTLTQRDAAPDILQAAVLTGARVRKSEPNTSLLAHTLPILSV